MVPPGSVIRPPSHRLNNRIEGATKAICHYRDESGRGRGLAGLAYNRTSSLRLHVNPGMYIKVQARRPRMVSGNTGG